MRTDKPYDFLVVGAGLFGAVFAHEMHRFGKRCLVIDKRPHIGGNIYCENHDGIQVHMYGAHIFHTNDERIWKFVNSIAPFHPFVNSPLAACKGRLFNLPFNMNTFYQLWGVQTPEAAKRKINEQVRKENILHPSNLEEQALSIAGRDIYEHFIKGYTEKQWGRPAGALPADIIKRIPLRFTFNNNYFNDRYQGLPAGGYNLLAAGLLRGVEVRLGVDFHKDRTALESVAEHIVYTGRIDEFFGYRFGRLEYRGLLFEHERLPVENYQGNAVVNYTEREVPYTRIIEHKHFNGPPNLPFTIITREYPQPVSAGAEPYYPVNDNANNKLYARYRQLAAQTAGVSFGGRLAEYRYYDMHQVIAAALARATTFRNTVMI